jgi:hypothetical protein
MNYMFPNSDLKLTNILGDRLDKVLACLLHVGFLLTSMLIIAFIGAPTSTKVLLVLFVSLNMLQIVMQDPDAAIPLPATVFLIVIGTIVHQFIHSMHHLLKSRTPVGAITGPERRQREAVERQSDLKVRIINKLKGLWSQLLSLTGLSNIIFLSA